MRAVGYNETIDKTKISPYLPDFVADGIINVDFEQLRAIGVKHLLIDLDNTLRQAYSRKLDQEVVDVFVKLAEKNTFKSINIVSNNNRNLKRYAEPLGARIFQPFWKKGLMVRKPSVAFYERVMNELNIKPKDAVMIGDKVRLDVAGANKVGFYTVLVRRRGRDYWFDYLLLARWREYRTLAEALKTKSRHIHSTPDYIRSSLKQLGLKVTAVTGPQHLIGGALLYQAGAGKQAVSIKVLTRWRSTANWLMRLWRYLRPSWNGEERPFFGPKHILEREAYVSKLTADGGVHTPAILGVLDLGDYRFGIATQKINGDTPDIMNRKLVTDEVLQAIWRELIGLHKLSIAHGDCRLSNITIDKKLQPWLCNLDFATTSATKEALRRDYAELLVSMALSVGAQAAAKAAMKTLDADTLILVRHELRAKNLSHATRTALRHASDNSLLENIRSSLAETK